MINDFEGNGADQPAKALQSACLRHVDRLSREAEAALLAAAPRCGKEIKVGIDAFRDALATAIPATVSAAIEGHRPSIQVERVGADTKLPLGKKLVEKQASK